VVRESTKAERFSKVALSSGSESESSRTDPSSESSASVSSSDSPNLTLLLDSYIWRLPIWSWLHGAFPFDEHLRKIHVLVFVILVLVIF
jgi:hypothetical protein